ncbi:hypothetical protein ZWY2020_053122 [Hordeum vulgare]|nr:hypothetical protein ZWY2020_053122 [Hordeum vulgare]
MDLTRVRCFGDSDLVAQQVSGTWDSRDPMMAAYRRAIPSRRLRGRICHSTQQRISLLSDDAHLLVKTLFLKIHEYSGSVKVFGTLAILSTLVLIDSKQITSVHKELQEHGNVGRRDSSHQTKSNSVWGVLPLARPTLGSHHVDGDLASSSRFLGPWPATILADHSRSCGVRVSELLTPTAPVDHPETHATPTPTLATVGDRDCSTVVAMLLWFLKEPTDQYDPEVCSGHLKKYTFKELRASTNNFNSKKILGEGGYGIVYKGFLRDGSIVDVKRLKDYNVVGGEVQFQTEVEVISLAVHRNFLRLIGFCTTECERLLVYPYMPNGSVASQLREHINGKPTLDWSRRKMIALAIVGDFGLAKLLDHQETHVTTVVRGTMGHIAPEYLSTGQSSKKTNVFGFGVLLVELITGQKALDFGRLANQKGGVLDLVKKLHQEKQLDMMVEKDLGSNYDRVELEEMVQVALLCTQYYPFHRPRVSEMIRMLEGDGLAEKWEASQNVDTPKSVSSELLPLKFTNFAGGDESSVGLEAMELSGPR